MFSTFCQQRCCTCCTWGNPFFRDVWCFDKGKSKNTDAPSMTDWRLHLGSNTWNVGWAVHSQPTPRESWTSTRGGWNSQACGISRSQGWGEYAKPAAVPQEKKCLTHLPPFWNRGVFNKTFAFGPSVSVSVSVWAMLERGLKVWDKSKVWVKTRKPPHLCPRNGLPLILRPFVDHPTLDDSSRSSKRKAYWPTQTVSKGIKVGAAGRGQRGSCPTLGHQKSLDNVGFSRPRAFNSATLSSASFSFDSGRVHDKRSRMATCVGKCKQHGHHGPPKPTLLKVFVVKKLGF